MSESRGFHDLTVGADQSNRYTIVRTEPQAERTSMVLASSTYLDGNSYTVDIFDKIVPHRLSIHSNKIDARLGP